MPYVRLGKKVLILPNGNAQKLSEKEEAILQACDGRRAAKELISELGRDPKLNLSETEVHDLLEVFSRNGVIKWTLEVPLEQQPERKLRTLIERIGDEHLRKPALDALAELESSRDAVARAAEDPGSLDYELETLEKKFSQITGRASTRFAGQTYATNTCLSRLQTRR